MYSTFLRKTILPYILRRENRHSALRYWREFENSQFWPKQKLLDYQWALLKNLIEYSYKNTEYYKDLFDQRGLNPDSFRSFEDLRLLPILTREDIYEQGDKLISRAIDRDNMMRFQTGGTTGQQAEMWRDQESYNIKQAIEWRFQGWMGYQLCDKMTYFWPAHIDIVEYETFKTKIKERYILRRQVLNAGISSEEAMHRFHNHLLKFKPRFLKVFPSALFNFAEFCRESNLKFPKIEAIMSSGEKLYDNQRNTFEEVFSCPVFDMYGSREVGNTGSECGEHRGMHIASEINYVEFIAGGKPAEYGQEGEIIVTDLTNYAMPLLRYRINDFGIPLNEDCTCGRTLPLMDTIVGRLQDDFWGPDGRRHSGNVLGIHMTVAEEGIIIGQIQFIQKALDYFHVRITNKPEPTPDAFEYIARRIKDIIGESVKVTIEVVDRIPPEKSGKVRYVICEIDPPEGSLRGR